LNKSDNRTAQTTVASLPAVQDAQDIARSPELTCRISIANAEHALGAYYAHHGRLEDPRRHYGSLSEFWQRLEDTEYVELQRKQIHILATAQTATSDGARSNRR
jgi:hypothetical protein